MKRLKRIMALVIAMAMVLSMGTLSAFADDNYSADSDTNNVTLDDSITIKHLYEGDKVTYYKIIEWEDGVGWKFTSNFENAAYYDTDGWVKGASAAEKTESPTKQDYAKDALKYIVGIADSLTDGANGSVTPANDGVKGRINSTLAALIADYAIQNNITADGTEEAVVADSGDEGFYKWTKSIAQTDNTNDAGLYLALIDAGKTGVMYNPIFVGADYLRDDATQGVGDTWFQNSWAVDLEDSYSDTAIAKRSEIDVDKTSTDSDSSTDVQNYSKNSSNVATLPGTTDTDGKKSNLTEEELAKTNEGSTGDIGESVKFVVNTTIPEYADNYTDIIFSITDTLTEGLVLDTTTGAVKVEAEYLDPADTTGASKIWTDITNQSIYATNKGPSDVTEDEDSFEIQFTHDYLHNLDRATRIRITYWAKITDEIGSENINYGSNTVSIKYSNNPNDKDDYGILKDVTNHYTFSIDADIFGEKEYETSEIVKIGVDQNGYPVTETKTLSNKTEVHPLAGAQFKLYKVEKAANAYTDNDLYTNTVFNGKIVTDANGKLKTEDGEDISGLDVGTYYLVETKAPNGYVKDTTVHTIKISATFVDKDMEETINGRTVKYSTQVLDTYTIAVDEGNATTATTSTYKMTYNDETAVTDIKVETALSLTNSSDKDSDGAVGEAADNSHFIVNTVGNELPSTGGIGTTIFYTVGAILVIGAGVILITRRRMEQ